MTEQELKQFEELAAKFETKDKDAVLKVVQAKMHPVFQDINDGGRSAANRDNEKKVTELTTERDQLKTRAEKAEQSLKDIDEKAPDVAKLRKTHEEQLEQLKQQHQQQLDAAKGETTAALLEVAAERLVDKLVKQGKIDEEYARTVLVKKDEVKNRLKVKDRKIEVLKQGNQELTIVPAEGKDALDHLAEELAEKVDARWKVSSVRRGSAVQGNQGGGGSGKTEFDEVRESVQQQSKEREKARQQGSGLERLGRRH